MIQRQSRWNADSEAEHRLGAELASLACYPDTDGRPMGENAWQVEWIFRLKVNLERLFVDRDDVLVAADLFWYPVEDRPDICRAPDVMVAFGRPKHLRMSYRQWEEDGVAPQVVFEILSPHQSAVELERLREFYQTYGTEEYYQLEPRLNRMEGWLRAETGRFEPIVSMHPWVSPRLGIRFDHEGVEPRIWLPNNRPLATVQELAEAHERAERLAQKLRELGVDPDEQS